MALIVLFLYLTGWHTFVISYLQRGLLATGLIRPSTAWVSEQTNGELPMPDLNVELVNGKGEPIHLEQFRGKVLFINLWATWCPPCLAEMPNIDQLYRELEPEEDIVFLMISTDREFSKAIDHIARQNFAFPVYQIRRGWPAELNSTTLPTTYVIDKQGRLVLEHRGMAKYNTQGFKEFMRGLK